MGWIKCSEQMPKPGVPVLAFVQQLEGRKWTRRIRAMYAAERTLEASIEDLADDGYDYDEDRDTYFVKPGWYENNEYEETHWSVNDPVTHWMPLPDPPVQP